VDRKEIRKLVKSHFWQLLKKEGYKKYKSSMFTKISKDNVLQIVYLEFGSIGFSCRIALQPLYIIKHIHGINLALGNRLTRFKMVGGEFWSYKDNPMEGIKKFEYLLFKNGLPWLEEYSNPRSIIKFIEKKEFNEYGLNLFWDYFQKQYQGFSHLYIGEIDKGVNCLRKMIGEISEDAVDFMHVYKKNIEKFIETIENKPELLPQILNDVIEDNKKEMKL